MGGHGGLNILPQKKWNVYNFENREKVRQDEEAAAREEQLKREESRRRDAEFRLDRLRRARGIHQQQPSSSDDSRHFNLFDGLPDFSSLGGAQVEDANRFRKRSGKEEAEEGGSKSSKKRRREDAPAPMAPEDEKYKLGYGVAGKGVKAPWYLSRPSALSEDVGEEIGVSPAASGSGKKNSGKKNSGKKTLEELREERMRREKKEKERERALLATSRKESGRAFQRRTFK